MTAAAHAVHWRHATPEPAMRRRSPTLLAALLVLLAGCSAAPVRAPGPAASDVRQVADLAAIAPALAESTGWAATCTLSPAKTRA